MSYAAKFSGLYFRTERPFGEVEQSFSQLKQEYEACWNREVYVRCEGDESDDGPCEVEVCAFGHGLTEGGVIYALCEWAQQWLGPNDVIRVYQASNSDAAGYNPFFHVVSREAISSVSVSDLFEAYAKSTKATTSSAKPKAAPARATTTSKKVPPGKAKAKTKSDAKKAPKTT